MGDALATTVAISPEAYGTTFSGEGVGSSIRLPLDWAAAAHAPVRFVVAAEALGSDTVVSCYVAHGERSWISIGAILRARTGGRLLGGLYGFVEDFVRNGAAPDVAAEERSPYRPRAGIFANPWVRGSPPSGVLGPLTQIRMTAYSPHPLENLLAEHSDEIEDFGVLVATGTQGVGQRTPIGARIVDPTPNRRGFPDLAGVPHV